MKRIFDFLIGLFGLIFLSPVFILISALIFITDGSPIVFKQDRVGKDNKLFKIYKFRTMKNNTGDYATADIENLDDATTKIGRILRKTSLDELPQLVNLVNGTMSLVGPRPLIPAESEIRELRAQYGVYSVLPGITGWAQVNGRDELPIEVKARFDGEYVRMMSLMQDVRILIATALGVLKADGIVEGKQEAEGSKDTEKENGV